MKEIYLGYMKSKFNLAMAAIVGLMVALSFRMTSMYFFDLRDQIELAHADFNISKAQKIMDNYSGFTYINDFFSSADYYIISAILLIIGFSAIAVPTLYRNLKSGHGNMIMVRESYSDYLRKVIKAQICYIFTWTMIMLIAVIAAGYIFSAIIDPSGAVGKDEMTELYHTAPVIVVQQLIMSIYLCLIIVIGTLSVAFFDKGIVIQLVPIALYAVPMLLAGTVANINESTAAVFQVLNPENVFSFLYSYIHIDRGMAYICLETLIFPVIMAALLVFVLNKNESKYKKAYLL